MAARRSAAIRPMPDVAPVMTTVLPLIVASHGSALRLPKRPSGAFAAYGSTLVQAATWLPTEARE